MRDDPSVLPAPALGLLMALLLLLLAPAPATAFETSGCQVELTTYNASGAVVDAAGSGGPGGSPGNPLVAEWDGTLAWDMASTARTAGPPGSWEISIFGIPTPMRGDVAAPTGALNVGSGSPFRWAGLFYVSGSVLDGDVECHGEGWIRVAGSPLGTVPFYAALALVALGGVLAAAGARGRPSLAIAGGVLLGVGAALVAVLFGLMPVGAWTPAVAAAGGVGAGAFIGLATWRKIARQASYPSSPS